MSPFANRSIISVDKLGSAFLCSGNCVQVHEDRTRGSDDGPMLLTRNMYIAQMVISVHNCSLRHVYIHLRHCDIYSHDLSRLYSTIV
jgi:hypothetical protein